ncbi:MAG: rhodanese-like domain-containing protein [Desulfobacterales bacterium]
MKSIGIGLALLAGIGLILFRPPSIEEKQARLEPELREILDARKVQVDPAELLHQIYDFNTRLKIFDVRSESEYNLFHIVDAENVSLEQLRDSGWVKLLPEETVFVLVSNDEKKATDAWKILMAQGILNLYILEGGVNFWLDLYLHRSPIQSSGISGPNPSGDDTLRHDFEFALGAGHPAADIDPRDFPERNYTRKIKQVGRVAKKSGSCG